MPAIDTSSGRSPLTLSHHLKQRRQRLADQLDQPVVLWSGQRMSRNFPANSYPFRASSHFLYFAGQSIEKAAIHLDGGRLTLFLDDPAPSAALWHGPTPSRDQWAEAIAADAAYPYSQLADVLDGALTLPVQDPRTQHQQHQILQRSFSPTGADADLVQAIVSLRLQHDDAALAELEQAAQVTVQAHQAGLRATASTEAQVRAAMEQVIVAANMTCAYNSIVTVHGEVLHNEVYHHPLQPGDLLLADVGAETAGGWAADITRTWPVSGTFSSSQRSLYEVVLAAHDACIAAIQPEVEYRSIHLLGAATLAAGLVDLGILHGAVEDLVDQDVHALFFPHGIGHLLGLDVHDMEDLGDLAGYAPGRQRSDRFGLGYLRLDRPLLPGMVVTIEPGFYQVPALLNDPDRRSRYASWVNWERLAHFADVRGIRIEDDVLVTDQGHRVLTADLPTSVADLEDWMAG
ncbi:MAG TPA: aminopeptidase P family protein [Candidatus Obscuribacterales bacterium]